MHSHQSLASEIIPETVPLPNALPALFFDIDGTLAPLALTPAQAHIPASSLKTLIYLRDILNGAVALVSGRTLADMDRMCAPYHFAGAGQHGLEVRDNGGNVTVEKDEKLIIQHISENVRMLHSGLPELIVEYKGLSVAVHYRTAPQYEVAVRDFMQQQAAVFAPDACLQEGKMVCEIRLCSANKGAAIRALLKTAGFAGKMPVFIGDDVTDEDGFIAVNALDGMSIKIGEGHTQARYRMDKMDQLQDWLQLLGSDTIKRQERNN